MEELVAQLVEQYTFNVWALGSSPSQFTKDSLNNCPFFILNIQIYSIKKLVGSSIVEHPDF
jgi:hypothetical protein